MEWGLLIPMMMETPAVGMIMTSVALVGWIVLRERKATSFRAMAPSSLMGFVFAFALLGAGLWKWDC